MDVLEKFTPWWQIGVGTVLSKLVSQNADVIGEVRTLASRRIPSDYTNTIHHGNEFISNSCNITEAVNTWHTSHSIPVSGWKVLKKKTVYDSCMENMNLRMV